jgi:hypothetical protein
MGLQAVDQAEVRYRWIRIYELRINDSVAREKTSKKHLNAREKTIQFRQLFVPQAYRTSVRSGEKLLRDPNRRRLHRNICSRPVNADRASKAELVSREEQSDGLLRGCSVLIRACVARWPDIAQILRKAANISLVKPPTGSNSLSCPFL